MLNKVKKLGEFSMAGQRFTIWETDDEDLHGLCDVDNNDIYVNHQGRKQDTIENTVLHEILHAAVYHHGGNLDYLDEGMIRSMTAALHQVIQSEDVMRLFQYKKDKRFKTL